MKSRLGTGKSRTFFLQCISTRFTLFRQFLHEWRRKTYYVVSCKLNQFCEASNNPKVEPRAPLYLGLQDSAVSLSPRNRSFRDRETGTIPTLNDKIFEYQSSKTVLLTVDSSVKKFVFFFFNSNIYPQPFTAQLFCFSSFF